MRRSTRLWSSSISRGQLESHRLRFWCTFFQFCQGHSYPHENGVSIVMGAPPNGCYIRENPIKMDDLGVPLPSTCSAPRVSERRALICLRGVVQDISGCNLPMSRNVVTSRLEGPAGCISDHPAGRWGKHLSDGFSRFQLEIVVL